MTDRPAAADLDAMEARCDAATRGPWIQMAGKYVSFDTGESPQVFRAATEADEEFILGSRTDLPAVIALAREAMGLLDAANEYVPGDDPVGRALGRDIDTLLTAYHGPGDGQPKGGAA